MTVDNTDNTIVSTGYKPIAEEDEDDCRGQSAKVNPFISQPVGDRPAKRRVRPHVRACREAMASGEVIVITFIDPAERPAVGQVRSMHCGIVDFLYALNDLGGRCIKYNEIATVYRTGMVMYNRTADFFPHPKGNRNLAVELLI